MNGIYFLTIKESLTDIGHNLKIEFLDLLDDFKDFFLLIKTHTYDILCMKFGTEVVNLFGIALIFLAIMLIATKVINK